MRTEDQPEEQQHQPELSVDQGSNQLEKGEDFSGLDELVAPPPDEHPERDRHNNLESERSRHEDSQQSEKNSDENALEKQESEGLDEIAAPAPGEDEEAQRDDLESERQRANAVPTTHSSKTQSPMKRAMTQLYLISYLILFSILGVLARLGLVALTKYPGAPAPNTVLWANVGGSLIIGFLREDRLLFRSYYKKAEQEIRSNNINSDENTHEAAILKSFLSKKSATHLYIGLAVGFCGSFTSFADIIRDGFFAISDNFDTAEISTLHTTALSPRHRSDGYSVMALIGITWLEISMSLGALQFGVHLAEAVKKFADYVDVPEWEFSVEKYLDVLVLVLGWGVWIGAIIMAIFPPHDHNAWRGQVLFALVFGPLGCLLRFFLAISLNRRIASFPLGTFIANIFGTCILGMVLDLQYSQLGGRVGCQVLNGIGDGFCGALTTVSTWVLELRGLKRRHAYFYGAVSVGVGLGFMVVIMGSLRWTRGFEEVVCEV